MTYPKWRYHAYKEAVVAKSEEHDLSLGEGWADNPSVFGRDTANAPEASKEEISAPPVKVSDSKETKKQRKRAEEQE